MSVPTHTAAAGRRQQGYIGQPLLVALIHCYRRCLSGRGPFRRTRCSFAACESCSAFGLRIATEAANSFPQAVLLIWARLRRCDRAYLYRSAEGLAWGELFDVTDPKFLRRELIRGAETDQTVAAVIRSATLVGEQQGDRRTASSFEVEADRYELAVMPLGPTLASPIPGLRRRLVLHLLLVGVLLAAVFGLELPVWACLACCCAAVMAVGYLLVCFVKQRSRTLLQHRLTNPNRVEVENDLP